mgnify:FL=1
MIKHIVFWKFKAHAEGADRQTNVLKARRLLDRCADIVPGTLRYEVLARQSGWDATVDLMLYAEFSDAQALEAYQQHPTHLEVKRLMGPLREARDGLDCDTNLG